MPVWLFLRIYHKEKNSKDDKSMIASKEVFIMVRHCKQIRSIGYQSGYTLKNRILTSSSIVGNYNGEVIAKVLGDEAVQSLVTAGRLSHSWWGGSKGLIGRGCLKRPELERRHSHAQELSRTERERGGGNLLASAFLLSSNLLWVFPIGWIWPQASARDAG